jgi:quercetin dioxygenase-like cupin family protein
MEVAMERLGAAGPKLKLLGAAGGVALGLAGAAGLADTAIPTEHRGVDIKLLGAISAESMAKQIGLEGYKLQLREITIAPGGQIARHSHATRPGLVRMLSGSWTEGRPGGETTASPGDEAAILEDAATEHWFWNRGAEPATALVCDIVPAE